MKTIDKRVFARGLEEAAREFTEDGVLPFQKELALSAVYRSREVNGNERDIGV